MPALCSSYFRKVNLGFADSQAGMPELLIIRGKV